MMGDYARKGARMLNDSERREIAEAILGTSDLASVSDVLRRHADLIDRPTCRNIGGVGGTNGEYYDFFCSVCGFSSGVTDPKYCPNCGAKVVE